MSTQNGPPADWQKDPDFLEKLFHDALSDGEPKVVMAVLHLLALADPDRCQRLHDDLKTALHIAAGGEVRVRTVIEPV